jgi:hypothetical protein
VQLPTAALIPYTVVGGARRDYVYGCSLVDPTTGRGATKLVLQCDEGSDVSAVTATVASAIGAAPAGQVQITGVDGRPFLTPVYVLSLYTPYGVVRQHPFVQMPIGGTDGLIGNDILSRGVFLEDDEGFWLAIGTAAPPSSTRTADALFLGGVAALLAAIAFGVYRGRAA